MESEFLDSSFWVHVFFDGEEVEEARSLLVMDSV